MSKKWMDESETPVQEEKDYTYRSMQDERQYGLFWYSGLWHILRPILIALTVMVLVIGICTAVWHKLYAEFAAPMNPNDETGYTFEITSGQSLSSVAQKLEGNEKDAKFCPNCGVPLDGKTQHIAPCQGVVWEKDKIRYCLQCGSRVSDPTEPCVNCGAVWKPQLIHSKTVFKYYCDFAGLGQKIQVGTYTLRKGMSMQEIAEQLTTGDGNPTVRNITLIPGETIEEFAAKLVRNGVLESSDMFLSLCRDGSRFTDFYYIQDVADSGTASQRKYVLEGYLAPNTYEVYIHATEEEIIRKLLSQTEAVFPLEYQEEAERLAEKMGWPKAQAMDKVLTLASLIEKEAKEQDFAKVSAVFHNRLKAGMKLESDVTIHYITGIRKMALVQSDTAINSPYNTYQRTGLPVGPICNPSPAAVKAALYPDQTYVAENYLFFCAREPESGELVFSRTLAEHNHAVENYRQKWEEYDESRGIQ